MTFQMFQYRIYPAPDQEARLRQWEGGLRYIWNLANEQRVAGLARCRLHRVYPSAFDQTKQLTALRAEVPWLEEVMRDACDSVLANLDEAWSECFAGKAGRPHFKAKDRDAMSVHAKDKRLLRFVHRDRKVFFTFPKIGHVETVLHRPYVGKIKNVTITRDVDQWFLSVCCETPDAPVDEVPEGGPVGVDRGVANIVADSEGRQLPRPTMFDDQAAKVKARQRELDRKRKGSKNRAKAKERLAVAHRKARRQREHVAHVLSYYYAKNHSVVVLEELRIENMTRSAKGTIEDPGSHVAQKAGLNRVILGSCWGMFATFLDYKVKKYGGVVVKVPAAYSSQECAGCHMVDAANRPDQATFRCVGCGHEDHADVNAAKVLVYRYHQLNNRRTGGEEVCGGDPVTGPAKQKRRSARSAAAAKKTRAKTHSLPAGNGLHRLDDLAVLVVPGLLGQRHPHALHFDLAVGQRAPAGGGVASTGPVGGAKGCHCAGFLP